jgi:hypothetical protein
MKKLIPLFVMMILNVSINAQTAKEMLAEINGKWELDDNNNVTFVKLIEAPGLSKDEIFNRALNYFTYNYVSGKSVIQHQDKEAGLIVGKGLYSNVHTGVSLQTTLVDAWHILRVDVKDGKARAIVTLTDYEKQITASNGASTYSTMKISSEYPINSKGMQKTVMSKAFYKSYQRTMKTLNAVDRAIKEGNTSKSVENTDW